MGEQCCSEFAEEQSSYKSKQPSKHFKLATFTSLEFSQAPLPWELGRALYLASLALKISHSSFTAAHARNHPQRPQSSQSTHGMGIPQHRACHPEPSCWDTPATLGGSSSGLLPLEEHLETSPDSQRWKRTSEGQQGRAGAHPSIMPVIDGLFLPCAVSVEAQAASARSRPGCPGCAWQWLDPGRSCIA